MTDTVEPTQTMVERDMTIAARPATVFAFLIDPQRIVQWMGKMATIDPRPGGLFRLDYNGRDIARGAFIEIVPNEKVVLSWGWEAVDSATPPGASTVEITLQPEGKGTRLRLRHLGLTPGEAMSHAEGWDHFLPQLVQAATT